MIKKVILLTEVISPYRIPVFNEIAKCEQIEFKVLFLAETVSGRLWNIEHEKIRFQHQILRGLKIPLPNRFPTFFNLGIDALLKKENPDVVICGGYHHPSFLSALYYAKKFNKHFVLWCESHMKSLRLKNPWADFYRKKFINASDSFIVPGRKSFDFIKSFGINGKAVCIAPNAVNNDFFSQNSALTDPRFPSKNILYVGRMVDSKGINILLRAFQDISNSSDTGLILVGEGKDQPKYEAFCQENNLKNVFFEGFKQQNELAKYYKLADLFVLPSIQEEWGLVLNEAAASGLPLIATEASGAAFDLIDEGKNGFRIPAGNMPILRDSMLKILGNAELKKSMKEYSRKKADNFSPQKCAEGFIQAILSETVKS